MKFYIFRHGETYYNKQYGLYDKDNFQTPLLYEGKEVVERLANFLKDIPSDYNVSSPFERCRETVKIISEISGKEFLFDERVGEFYKENYQEYREKIEDFLKEVEEKGYQSVIICTHGATMSQLIHLICDESPEKEIPVSEYDSTGVLVVIEDRKIREIDFNLG